MLLQMAKSAKQNQLLRTPFRKLEHCATSFFNELTACQKLVNAAKIQRAPRTDVIPTRYIRRTDAPFAPSKYDPAQLSQPKDTPCPNLQPLPYGSCLRYLFRPLSRLHGFSLSITDRPRRAIALTRMAVNWRLRIWLMAP